MNTAVLAIDIGASSGRHMLGKLENGKLTLEEIYRFPNGTVKKNGRLCWNHQALWAHILAGMKKCAEGAAAKGPSAAVHPGLFSLSAVREDGQ